MDSGGGSRTEGSRRGVGWFVTLCLSVLAVLVASVGATVLAANHRTALLGYANSNPVWFYLQVIVYALTLAAGVSGLWASARMRPARIPPVIVIVVLLILIALSSWAMFSVLAARAYSASEITHAALRA